MYSTVFFTFRSFFTNLSWLSGGTGTRFFLAFNLNQVIVVDDGFWTEQFIVAVWEWGVGMLYSDQPGYLRNTENRKENCRTDRTTML